MKSWVELFEYSFKKENGINSISDKFLKIVDQKLSFDCLNQIGLNPYNEFPNIFLLYESSHYIRNPYFEKELINNMNIMFGIFIVVFNVKIKWKSISGNIYFPSSTEIDEDDIEMWFDDLPVNDILNIWNDPAYNPKKLNFRYKKPSYDIKVDFFMWDSIYMHIKLKQGVKNSTFDAISDYIDKKFQEFNLYSESKKYRYGVIHNFGEDKRNENTMIYYIDYGSAIVKPMREVIEGLSVFDEIDFVIFCSKNDFT